MRDEKRKKKKKTKKETKRREKYYLAGRFLQRRRFHRLFHSEQAFHFRESLFCLSSTLIVVRTRCLRKNKKKKKEENFQQQEKETFSNKLVRLFSGTVDVNGDCV